MASGSRWDLAHLLTPVLLIEGWWQGLAVFMGAAPTMRQVPCEFQADRPNFIFQPAAPDMIWHIYSSQHCFKGVLGMDLLSSGDVALTMGQVPCEFSADWPTFIFQLVAPDMIWHIYSGHSHQEPLAEKWRLADLLETHRGPAQSWGHHSLKSAGLYLKPPWSSAAQSKCAESCQEPVAEKWRLADLPETHRGPSPW